MIRALLDGRKTQTRRALKLPKKTFSGGPIYERPDMGGWEPTISGGGGTFTINRAGERIPAPERVAIWHKTTGVCMEVPIQIGDRLWVREAWRSNWGQDSYDDNLGRVRTPKDFDPATSAIEYIADGTFELGGKNYPGMFMPRWASRLTLIVTDVRVQRLRDISGADSIAEGVQCGTCDAMGKSACSGLGCFASVAKFAALWNTINGPGAWESNPWVAAYSFTVHKRNIDAMSAT